MYNTDIKMRESKKIPIPFNLYKGNEQIQFIWCGLIYAKETIMHYPQLKTPITSRQYRLDVEGAIPNWSTIKIIHDIGVGNLDPEKGLYINFGENTRQRVYLESYMIGGNKEGKTLDMRLVMTEAPEVFNFEWEVE